MKIVIESKSKVSKNIPAKWKLSESPNPRCPRILPPNENCHRIQIQGVPEYSPQMKIVIESKSEVSQNTPRIRESKSKNWCPRILPPNENCQGVQIQGVPEYPPKWKLSESPNPRCPRNTSPQNENCHRIQIQGVPEYSPPIEPQNENCDRVQIQGVPEYLPRNENCHRVQIWGVPEYPPPNVSQKWKLS